MPTLLVFEIVGVVVATVLLFGSMMMLGIAIEDFYYANTESSHYLARMIILQWALRTIGKALFLAVMGIVLASNNTLVLSFLVKHPYLTFTLAILGMVALSCSEYSEIIWRHRFLRHFASSLSNRQPPR